MYTRITDLNNTYISNWSFCSLWLSFFYWLQNIFCVCQFFYIHHCFYVFLTKVKRLRNIWIVKKIDTSTEMSEKENCYVFMNSFYIHISFSHFYWFTYYLYFLLEFFFDNLILKMSNNFKWKTHRINFICGGSFIQ